MRSAGFRFFIVAILTLLMFIPLIMVSEIVQDRRSYSRSTIESVGNEWGGRQEISGPQLVIPVSEEVTYTRKREVVDPTTGLILLHEATGEPIYETYEETVRESRASVFLFPTRFDVDIATETEMRHRGIFSVPVYRARIGIDFAFPYDAVEAALKQGEEADWRGAEIRLLLSHNRALRGSALLSVAGREVALEPMTERSGIVAYPGDPRAAAPMRLDFGLNGAQGLRIAPVGRQSVVNIVSDWPDPSFAGNFLPDASHITDAGFEAQWTIPHLARALPQVARSDHADRARQQAGFGVDLIETNDFYQKAWRAARYGILFIALTFLTVLLIDASSETPVHPVQYILIGLAQAIFVLLMLAYAEQVGFTPAYLMASGATIALLLLYGFVGLRFGRRNWVLAAMLIVLYAVLYLILQSTDFALIAGATLSFLALAATMVATRNESWYGPRGPGKGLVLRRAGAKPVAAATAEPGAASQQ